MYDTNGVHQTAPRIVQANSKIEAARRLEVDAKFVYDYVGEPLIPLDFETCRLLAHQMGWKEIQVNETIGSISFDCSNAEFIVCIFPNFNTISLTPSNTPIKLKPRLFNNAGQGLLGAIFIDPKQMYYNE